jgi:hypothetical protein
MILDVQNKVKICQNWHSTESSHLGAERAFKCHYTGIISNSDYSEVPGWKIERSDTNFRGQSGLCEDLQCSKIAARRKLKKLFQIN